MVYGDANANMPTFSNIHAKRAVEKIWQEMNSYVGTYIGCDEEMKAKEQYIQAVASDILQRIEPDVKVDVSMPSAEKGGSTAYLTISTEHPDKFGVTPQD
jgi:hypothetical protein